jgi:FtsH-binding integral membrane protein
MSVRKSINPAAVAGPASAKAAAGGLSAYVRRVFTYMAISLGLTAAVSFFMINTGFVFNLITDGRLNGLGTLLMFSPIILILGMAFIKQMQGSKLMLYTVAAIYGASLSLIVLHAGVHNAFQAFLLTGIIFGSMSMYGYLTKADLSKMLSCGDVYTSGVAGLLGVGAGSACPCEPTPLWG